MERRKRGLGGGGCGGSWGAVHDVYVGPVHGLGVECPGFGVWNQRARQVKHGLVSGVDHHLHLGPARRLLLRLQARAQRCADDARVIRRNGKKQLNNSGQMRRLQKRLVPVHVDDEFAVLRQRLLDFPQPFPAIVAVSAAVDAAWEEIGRYIPFLGRSLEMMTLSVKVRACSASCSLSVVRNTCATAADARTRSNVL
jgi:hypothetical protein